MKNIWVVLFLIFSSVASAQPSPAYTYPNEPSVRENLEHWRDLKFGIIIHWGIYAVPGIVESWSICNEDWVGRDTALNYEDYKKWYFGLSKEFNPTQFNPEAWSSSAKNAGMKYLVFTTKHHDGFCMFDSKYSDFKITNGPFKSDPKSNVTKEVFNAFRKENFFIGAYFSKPDWHSDYYWWHAFATGERNNNYDIRKFPEQWKRFQNYTANQISELTSEYGKVDMLWLDGGWVRPLETVNDEVHSWQCPIPAWSQDVNVPRLAEIARKNNPGTLVVDRTVHGEYENYRTPEQRIPNERLDYPWETCMTLGNAWGFVPNDQYKSSREVIHKLVEVIAKGGNLLLGVGPTPTGVFPEEVNNRLKEIGDWTSAHSEAIYGTRCIPNFRKENIYFVEGKSGEQYAFVLLKEGEQVPAEIALPWEMKNRDQHLIEMSTSERQSIRMKEGRMYLYPSNKILTLSKDLPVVVFRWK
jgi:alpha-L-fucosidase